MKKFIAGFVLGALLFGGIGAYAATQQETIEITRNVRKLVISGNGYETKSYEMGDNMFMSGGTTYVPLRFLVDTFNHFVDWDNREKTAHIYLDPCMTMAGVPLRTLNPAMIDAPRDWRAICVNERSVLLPKDVILEALKFTDHGIPSDQFPAYLLSRGERMILIGFKGMLFAEDKSELGDEFAFLSDYVYPEGRRS